METREKRVSDCEGDEVEEVKGWYVVLAEEQMVGIPYASGEASPERLGFAKTDY